jgi:hypothetical protein
MYKMNLGMRVLRNADGGQGGGGADPAAGGADPAAAAATASAAWTDSLSDNDLKEWSVNKGYNKFDAAAAAPVIAQQYRSLEKLVGAEKAGRTVEIPNFEDADAASVFYDRLGRPKAEDYDLALPKEGVNKDFETWTRGTFHKAGLTASQAKAIGGAWNEFVQTAAAADASEKQTQYEAEDKGLKTKWGATYDNKMSLASAAAKSLGVTGEQLDAAQGKFGYGTVMEMFANIAAKIGEDQFVGGEGDKGGSGMTPEEASAAIKAHRADKEWMASWMDKSHPKHKDAVARMAYLAEMQVAGR